LVKGILKVIKLLFTDVNFIEFMLNNVCKRKSILRDGGVGGTGGGVGVLAEGWRRLVSAESSGHAPYIKLY